VIFAGTYSTFHCSLSWNVSGLVGTLGVRIIDPVGAVVKTRTTSGIVEAVASSGFYVATINLTTLPGAPAPGHYYVFWDDGATTPGHVAEEDLMLAKSTTFGTALRELAAAGISTNSENINVGFFVS
jgi:hypothetical protein